MGAEGRDDAAAAAAAAVWGYWVHPIVCAAAVEDMDWYSLSQWAAVPMLPVAVVVAPAAVVVVVVVVAVVAAGLLDIPDVWVARLAASVSICPFCSVIVWTREGW